MTSSNGPAGGFLSQSRPSQCRLYLSVFVVLAITTGCGPPHLERLGPQGYPQAWESLLLDGQTMKQHVLETLGQPAQSYENGRILTYSESSTRPGGQIELNKAYDINLVLVFNSANILQRHSILKNTRGIIRDEDITYLANDKATRELVLLRLGDAHQVFLPEDKVFLYAWAAPLPAWEQVAAGVAVGAAAGMMDAGAGLGAALGAGAGAVSGVASGEAFYKVHHLYIAFDNRGHLERMAHMHPEHEPGVLTARKFASGDILCRPAPEAEDWPRRRSCLQNFP